MKLQNLLENLTERKTDYEFISLSSPSGQYIERIADAIEQGGQIKTSRDMLIENLKKCKAIAIVLKDEEVVGVGALKVPRDTYKQDVFRKIGKPELAEHFTYEMGYFYVNPSYRKDIAVIKGIMRELYKHRSDKNNIFMTIREGGHTDRPELLRLLGFSYLGRYDAIKVFQLVNWEVLRKKVGLNG
jgi:hypothetical protein